MVPSKAEERSIQRLLEKKEPVIVTPSDDNVTTTYEDTANHTNGQNGEQNVENGPQSAQANTENTQNGTSNATNDDEKHI